MSKIENIDTWCFLMTSPEVSWTGNGRRKGPETRQDPEAAAVVRNAEIRRQEGVEKNVRTENVRIGTRQVSSETFVADTKIRFGIGENEISVKVKRTPFFEKKIFFWFWEIK